MSDSMNFHMSLATSSTDLNEVSAVLPTTLTEATATATVIDDDETAPADDAATAVVTDDGIDLASVDDDAAALAGDAHLKSLAVSFIHGYPETFGLLVLALMPSPFQLSLRSCVLLPSRIAFISMYLVVLPLPVGHKRPGFKHAAMLLPYVLLWGATYSWFFNVQWSVESWVGIVGGSGAVVGAVLGTVAFYLAASAAGTDPANMGGLGGPFNIFPDNRSGPCKIGKIPEKGSALLP
ncbi:hypothetical protein C8R45DRAFT_1066809 [Mycena sanguinolenta]|nr:hypothetical protein C8R45DRAFT_1066809 [Mycena sanguinolenta]